MKSSPHIRKMLKLIGIGRSSKRRKTVKNSIRTLKSKLLNVKRLLMTKTSLKISSKKQFVQRINTMSKLCNRWTLILMNWSETWKNNLLKWDRTTLTNFSLLNLNLKEREPHFLKITTLKFWNYLTSIRKLRRNS